MNVSGAGRKIDQQKVKAPPVRFLKHLIQGLGGHGSAPNHRLVGCGKKSDGHDFDSIGLDRIHFALAVDLNSARNGALHVKHDGHARAIDVGIENAHAKAHIG